MCLWRSSGPSPDATKGARPIRPAPLAGHYDVKTGIAVQLPTLAPKFA